MNWAIAYKPDPKRPLTMSGRIPAHIRMFDTKELAEKYIASIGWQDWAQAVEV